MDFYYAIRELLEEKKRLDHLIAALEAIHNGDYPEKRTANVKRRRGRKAMSEEERREVSARMKRYWASRRNSNDSEAQSDPAIS